MVSLYETDNLYRQSPFSCYTYAIMNVRDNHLGCFVVRQFVECILTACLVLGEEERIGELAYVVVEGTGTGEQHVGIDGGSAGGCEVGYLKHMLE